MPSMRKAYKMKLEAELELAKAELVKLRAQVKVSTSDTRIACFKHIDQIEEAVDTAKQKLKDLAEAGENAWEGLMGDIERIWGELREVVQNSSSKPQK